MKRVICVVLSFAIAIMFLPMSAFAIDREEQTIYMDDGSYLTISLLIIQTRASGTKTATKTYQYTDSDGNIAWKAVLKGTFTYTGTNATCTSSACNVSIFDSSWYTISKWAGKSGGAATAELTMGLKLLGVTVKKVPLSMTLICDANGNLS